MQPKIITAQELEDMVLSEAAEELLVKMVAEVEERTLNLYRTTNHHEDRVFMAERLAVIADFKEYLNRHARKLF